MAVLALDIVERFAAASGFDTSAWSVKIEDGAIVVWDIADRDSAQSLATYMRKTTDADPVISEAQGWRVTCKPCA